MNYSRTVESIPASPIRKMMTKAARISDCISFAVGEPDFAPCDAIIDVAKKALDERDTKYAPGAGIDELRETYAKYLSKITGIRYDSDEVVVTVGGMASLYLGLLCMIDPGDEVIISAPYFSNYEQEILMCKGIPINVDVSEENDFVLKADALREKITEKTKIIMINSPCNPTGAVIEYDTLNQIADIAREHDLFVISDEVYRHIIFDGAEYHSIVEIPGMKERTLIIDSCSKTFAMTGFRVGFGAGPKEIIDLMTKVTEGVYSAAVTFSERAAVEAFLSGFDHCEEMIKEYQKRRDYICNRIDKIKGISCRKPKGAFYVFANIEKSGMNADTFCEKLLEEKHVAVVPGNHFGSDNGSKYIRISYATSMENIEEGMDRLEEFLGTE